MKIAFVGGGTGGHLTPAVGLAEKMQERGHSVEFWLGGREVETSYVKKEFVQHSLRIDTSKLPRPLAVLRSLFLARKYGRRFKPDVVVSMGGYAGFAAIGCLPSPLVCLEGNFVVGTSIRLLSFFAKITLVMFPGTAEKINKSYVMGPVQRNSTRPCSRKEGLAFFDFDFNKPVLATMGGSQGALAVNDCLEKTLPYASKEGWQIIALTGSGKSDRLKKIMEKYPHKSWVGEHCDDMNKVYAAANFIMSRGGASTIAEIWLHKKPSLILPYPHADRQQYWNASQLSPAVDIAKGDNDFEQLISLLSDQQKRESMLAAFDDICIEDGADNACDILEEIGALKS